jgi:hypothetical protein
MSPKVSNANNVVIVGRMSFGPFSIDAIRNTNIKI